AKQQKELLHIEEKIKILDPINILKRGYSITLYNNKPIKNSEDIKEGDKIKTKLMNGELTSIITKINKNGE
ncbi:MAG TPA: exodeoxyribonuclease VII large subunit, partial [Bacteroidales bacterium]|nr:exodeoxyribonuclease VII large subunit [Bacteroidales bacterium]